MVGHASNPAGQSVLPDPISNAVRLDPPPVPVPGSVNITEGDTVTLDTTIHATTTGWSGNPSTYTFAWRRHAGQPCASASFSGNWDTDTNNTPDDTLGNTPNSLSEGNRCYRVSVTATNAGGDSATTATDLVFVQNPLPPAGGTVAITEGGTAAINTTLHATTTGWSGSPTSYTFLWQQGTAGQPCASASFSGNWDTDTNNTPDDTLGNAPNSASEGNRCYQVTVTATGLGGPSVPPRPTAQIFITVSAAADPGVGLDDAHGARRGRQHPHGDSQRMGQHDPGHHRVRVRVGAHGQQHADLLRGVRRVRHRSDDQQLRHVFTCDRHQVLSRSRASDQ